MAGFAISLEVEGLEDAIRTFEKVKSLGKDPRPLLEIAAAVFESSTIRRFDEEKGPGGIPWPKSQPALGNAPRASGRRTPGKTLVDTSDLRDSILPGNKLKSEIRPFEIEFGSDGLKNPVKAIANQMGSHRQTVVLAHSRTINSAFGVSLPEPRTVSVRAHGRMTNLPARPFIGVDEADKADIRELWQDHLRGLFR